MRAHATTLALVLAAAGCGGASPETGITANLRLAPAQYVPGPLEADTAATGPTVFVNLGVAKVSPGVQNLPLSGNVQAGVSVLVGLEGDVGHWIVPASVKDALEKDSYQFSTRMAFSPELPPGPQKLDLPRRRRRRDNRTVPAVRADGRPACPDRRAGLLAHLGHPGRPGPARRRPEHRARIRSRAIRARQSRSGRVTRSASHPPPSPGRPRRRRPR